VCRECFLRRLLQLHEKLLTLKMTSAQVVETSVTNNSSFQNYSHPADYNIRTTKSSKSGKAEITRSFQFLRDMRWFFCYSLGESWYLLTTLGVGLVNNIERDTIVWRKIFILHFITCVGISHPRSPLSSEDKFVFLFANQQKHVLLC